LHNEEQLITIHNIVLSVNKTLRKSLDTQFFSISSGAFVMPVMISRKSKTDGYGFQVIYAIPTQMSLSVQNKHFHFGGGKCATLFSGSTSKQLLQITDLINHDDNKMVFATSFGGGQNWNLK